MLISFQIGGLKAKLTSNYPKATDALHDFRKFMLLRAKTILRQKKKGRTNLAESLKGVVKKRMNRGADGRFTGGSSLPSLEFSMNSYGKYVDEGVQGVESTKAPMSPYRFTGRYRTVNRKAISEWLARKGKPQSLTYVIARSIYKKGIKPTHFWNSPFKKAFPRYVKKYHKAVADDIAVNIANQITKALKNGVQNNSN